MKERVSMGTKDNLRVQISPRALERLGEPSIDYDGLQDLFYDHFDVSSDAPVVVDLYAGTRLRYGYCMPSAPDTLHVNVTATERKNVTTAALLHEGKHLADRNNRPARCLGLTALRLSMDAGAFILALLATAESNTVAESILLPVGLMLGHLYNTAIDPLELDALRVGEDAELLERYANLVVFPNGVTS